MRTADSIVRRARTQARLLSRAPAWAVAVSLALVAVVLRLPAFFSSRHLLFDDGVYGVSVIDMRRGLAPYTGVFSSQGPLHFPLLYGGDLLGFRTLNSPRVTPVLLGAVAAVGVWAIARRCGARDAVALVAGLLVATTGTMLWTTGQITGDGPATALAVCAVWAAVMHRDHPTIPRALLTGVAFGAAIAVKPLVAAAAIPVGWWLLTSGGSERRERRVDHLAAAALTSILTWFVLALPWGVSRVWEQSVEYNTGAGPRFSHWSQLDKLWSTLVDRDLVLLVAVALGLVAALLAARRGGDRPGAHGADVIVIASWLVVTAVVLVMEPAMYRNHLAMIVPPLALLFALRPPPLRWLTISLIVTLPWAVVHLDDILWPSGYSGNAARLVDALRELPDDARAISDDPGFVWRAGLSTPRLMNDTAMKRIMQGSLTTESVTSAAAERETCAVVIWSTRFGRDLPGLRESLADVGYELQERYAVNRELWTKPECMENA
jgi:hypothetical protein